MAAMKASLRALTTVVPMDPMKVAKRGSLKAWRKAELKDEKTVDYLVVKMDVKMVGWTEMMLADKMVVSMATTLAPISRSFGKGPIAEPAPIITTYTSESPLPLAK